MILILLAVLAPAAGMLYQRPVPLAQLCPEIVLDTCSAIVGYCSADKAGMGERLVFPSGSEEFDLLMENHQQWAEEIRRILAGGA